MAVCDRCVKVIPHEKIPYGYFTLPIVDAYYRAGERDKGKAVLTDLIDYKESEINYFLKFEGAKANGVDDELQRSMAILRKTGEIAKKHNEKELSDKIDKLFEKAYQKLMTRQ